MKLNPNKSPGPDEHHPLILKELIHEISLPLSIVFTKCIAEKYIPQSWREANVTALFKKGNKSNPCNYRPVSLTSIICKLLESVIKDKIFRHMELNKLFSANQNGFIKGRSCSTNLLAVMDKWTESLDLRLPVDTIYLDFAKAFDSVPHKRLLLKLQKYGINGQVLNWIKEFLGNRRQYVKIKNTKSKWAPVTSGIPQVKCSWTLSFCYIYK